MKKSYVFAFLFVTLILLSGNVSATVINFDTLQTSIVHSTGSALFSFPTPVCVIGVSVDNISADTVNIVLNGKLIYSTGIFTSSEVGIPVHECNNTFRISVSQANYINGQLTDVGWSGHIQIFYVPASDTIYYSLKAPVQSYIPPGAADTARGFSLNASQLKLNQTFSMSEGTISFYLKWGGDNAVILYNSKLKKPVVYIKNSSLIVSSTDANYSFPGPIPQYEYVPVYISFKQGTGYIMVNNTRISIVWAGNISFDEIGDGSKTSTIIDEVHVINTYLSPEQAVIASSESVYTILWRGKKLTITAEGGTTLGTLDISFLSDNLTVLNSTKLTADSTVAVAPNSTTLIVISRSGISRRYWLGNYTEIAFPAENVQLVSSTITIRPTTWQYLTLKTPDGRVATRVKLDSTQTASVMAVLGSDYIISLENGNTTKSMLYTITGDISLWVENDTAKYQGKYITAQLDDDNKLLIVSYYDQSAETKELHISIRAYDANNNLKYEINDIAVEGPVAYYRLALPVANDSDVMLYKIILNADGHVYERTVFGDAGGGSVLPSNIVPSGLVLFGAGVVGALMFVAINAYLMPFGALMALSAVKFLGWANVSPYVLGMLGVFSALAMLMYRRDQGVG